MLLHRRNIILRNIGIGSSIFMLSGIFLPWLLLPFQSHFPCGLPHSLFPSQCPSAGEVAFQTNLWQVFTQQVSNASNQLITYIGIIPVGVMIIILGILLNPLVDHLPFIRFSYMFFLVIGMAAQCLVTYVMITAFPMAITAFVPPLVLFALPYILYFLTFIGGLTLFSSPNSLTVKKN